MSKRAESRYYVYFKPRRASDDLERFACYEDPFYKQSDAEAFGMRVFGAGNTPKR